MPFPLAFWKHSEAVAKGSAFIGNGSSSGEWLTVPGSADWAVGTGNFTIEWFQRQDNSSNENYAFAVGNFGVSISSGAKDLVVYIGGFNAGSKVISAAVTVATSTWYHVAISRSGTTLNAYFNGTRVASVTNSSNITDSSSTLFIGTKDNSNPYNDNWPGNLSNFRWVKGTALYTGTTLTVPTSNLTAVANTKLLLLFENSASFLTDSSGTGKVVSNGGASSWSALAPF